MTTVTARPFVSPTDLSTLLTLARQSATPDTLFDNPRYSDLATWLAPAGVVAHTTREDEGYRQQMIQSGTTLWETDTGEAVAYAMIPFTTSLSFGVLPQWRDTALLRAILSWGLAHLRERCRVPFLMTRCHEQDVHLQAALIQEGFQPEPYQDVYLTRPLDPVPAAPALPAGFRLDPTKGPLAFFAGDGHSLHLQCTQSEASPIQQQSRIGWAVTADRFGATTSLRLRSTRQRRSACSVRTPCQSDINVVGHGVGAEQGGVDWVSWTRIELGRRSPGGVHEEVSETYERVEKPTVDGGGTSSGSASGDRMS